MLLARATVRQQEISLRAALGASRGRLIRQLLVESTLLAVGGMVAGSLFAYAGIGALARFMPRQGVPWETQLRLDQPVLFFALGTAALATLIFGLFPALQGARRELMTASKRRARRNGDARAEPDAKRAGRGGSHALRGAAARRRRADANVPRAGER